MHPTRHVTIDDNGLVDDPDLLDGDDDEDAEGKRPIVEDVCVDVQDEGNVVGNDEVEPEHTSIPPRRVRRKPQHEKQTSESPKCRSLKRELSSPGLRSFKWFGDGRIKFIKYNPVDEPTDVNSSCPFHPKCSSLLNALQLDLSQSPMANMLASKRKNAMRRPCSTPRSTPSIEHKSYAIGSSIDMILGGAVCYGPVGETNARVEAFAKRSGKKLVVFGMERNQVWGGGSLEASLFSCVNESNS